MAPDVHPAAAHHLPSFVTAPGETDVLFIVVGVVLAVAVLVVGNLFLTLHTLPERMAHASHKLQFEIVAVLGLLALFTHVHLFWVLGLLLALIDIPDVWTPLRRMAASLERLAGKEAGEDRVAREAEGGSEPTTRSAPDGSNENGAAEKDVSRA